MNNTLAAAVATLHQQRLIADAASYRRSHSVDSSKARRRGRVHAFLKDVVAASL